MIRVLIVEDEHLVRKGLILTTPWNDYGFEVVGQAENGWEGYNLAMKVQPDLVITDIKMPVMDGLVLIQKLVDTIETEFLIISGYNHFEYAKQAMKLGVKDYLLKPIDDLELEEVLKRIAIVIKNKKQYQKVQNNLEQMGESKVMLFKEYLLADELKVKEKYVREAIHYLKEHFREEMSLKEVAQQLGISESYLIRIFKIETGHTFIEYLTNYRIVKAIELLKDKAIKVYEVSGMVGYNDSRYFSALFKKYVGVTPSEFKDGLN